MGLMGVTVGIGATEVTGSKASIMIEDVCCENLWFVGDIEMREEWSDGERAMERR